MTNAGKKELTGNSLKPATTAEGLAEKETVLVLSGKAFENYTGETFVADKAYMPYSGTTGDAIEIVFDGATCIENVGAENNILDRAVIKTIENGKLVIKTANGKFSTSGARVK